MPERPHVRDLEILRDVDTIRAIAQDQRLAILALLTRQRLTGAMMAERTGIPANRVHYHLSRMEKLGLVIEVPRGPKRRNTERLYTASARHFIVDPGLALHDPGMVAALDSSLESMFFDWRRKALLNIDVSGLARRIVLDSARVQSGESVLVAYGRFGTELGEAVLVEVEAAGARGLVRPWSANWLLRTLDRYDDESLDQLRFVSDAEDRRLDAAIVLTTNVPEGPPPDAEQRRKLPAMLDVMSRWQRDIHARGVRYVEFNLPFRGEFESGSMPPEDGATVFWKAVMTDLEAVGLVGGRLHERIATGPRLRLTSEGGTALDLAVDPDSIAVRDGVVTAHDVANRHSTETLPAGTLVAVPLPAQTHGTFVADYTAWSGIHAVRPRLVLRKGRIVEIDAGEHTGFFREMLTAAKGDGDLIAMVSFGINPAGRGPTGKASLDSCLEGTVTLHFGNNELIGGTVTSTLGLTFPNATLSVESNGVAFLRDGVYVWTRESSRGAGRYDRSGLGAADVQRLAGELLHLFETDRPYLDPEFRLEDVARTLSISTNHLSQVLRQGIGSTFTDLVNRHRVEEFLRRVRTPESRNLTHLSIAQDCGFASKASFYRNFKRVMGKTPAELLEQDKPAAS